MGFLQCEPHLVCEPKPKFAWVYLFNEYKIDICSYNKQSSNFIIKYTIYPFIVKARDEKWTWKIKNTFTMTEGFWI